MTKSVKTNLKLKKTNNINDRPRLVDLLSIAWCSCSTVCLCIFELQLELRRLYTQLQVYKTKSMRRDNPHISKRRGGRKPTHRRFSLQAFHYKHRLQQTGEQSIGEGHDLEPASKTPEESTNSADIGQIASQCYTDELVTSSPRTPHSGAIRKQ